jgi:glutaminyl-tRNA synthetase
MFERLFKSEAPEAGDFLNDINPNSVVAQNSCKAEPCLISAKIEEHFQFLRHGYFILDPDSKPGALIFNRSVSLKDSWTKKK